MTKPRLKKPGRSALWRSVLCFPLFILTSRAGAGSTVPLPLQTLSERSGQVIVGRVVSVRSYWADQPRRIESAVMFESVEYLKGRIAGSTDTFRLIVPGGKVGEIEMRIAHAPVFAVGEKWLLFLLPAYKTFPVVGLNQGAFRVETDAAGVERVHLSDGRAFLDFGADGLPTTIAAQARPSPGRLLVADRVSIRAARTEARPAQAAMSLSDFRQHIAPVLQVSRDHQLTEPAGRRVLVVHTPVPLRDSGGPAASETTTKRPAVRARLAPQAASQPRREPSVSGRGQRP